MNPSKTVIRNLRISKLTVEATKIVIDVILVLLVLFLFVEVFKTIGMIGA